MTIYQFDDYKRFLKAYLLQLPRRGRGEISRWATHLQVNATLISQILNGRKSFTLEQAQELTEFMALNPDDSDYLMLLVEKGRAGTPKLRKYWQTRIEKRQAEVLQLDLTVGEETLLSEADRAVFYSSWHYSAIRLITSIDGFQTAEAIADHFDMSRSKVAEILRFLLKSGLLAQDNGLYCMGTQRPSLPPGSPLSIRHHLNWRMKTVQKADTILEDELLFTAPMTLSRRDFAALRQDIVNLIKAASERVSNSRSEQLSCLNIDLIRL
jgi:uncharacterized protein (TIGR02147 family)